MKKLNPALVVLIILFTSCHSSENSNQESVPVDTVNSGTIEMDSSEFKKTIVNIPSLWTIESPANSLKDKLIKPSNDDLKQFSPQQLVEALNENFQGIQLNFDNVSNDTIYVSIPQSGVLVNQSGDTGAYNYLATVVYNLTELTRVKYVNFKFTAGDHATPGTYSRDDFKRLR